MGAERANQSSPSGIARGSGGALLTEAFAILLAWVGRDKAHTGLIL